MPSQQWINVLVVLYAVIASEVAVVIASSVYLYRSRQPMSEHPWVLITLLNGLGVVAGTVLLAWLLMG